MTALKIRQCRGSAGTGKDYHFVVGGWPRVPVHGTTVHAVVLCRESRVGWVSSHKPNFKLRSVTTSHSAAAEPLNVNNSLANHCEEIIFAHVPALPRHCRIFNAVMTRVVVSQALVSVSLCLPASGLLSLNSLLIHRLRRLVFHASKFCRSTIRLPC
jgi:hypothetical protein